MELVKLAKICKDPNEVCLKDVDMESEKANFIERITKKGYKMNKNEYQMLESFVSKISSFASSSHEKGIIMHVKAAVGSILWFHEWIDSGDLSYKWEFYVEVNPTFTMNQGNKEYSITITLKGSIDSMTVKVHDPVGWFKEIDEGDLKVVFDGPECIAEAIEHVRKSLLS